MSVADLTILSHPFSAETDRRLQHIVGFAGLESSLYFLNKNSANDGTLRTLADAEPTVIVSSAVAMASIMTECPDLLNCLLRPSIKKRRIFVYGFRPDERLSSLAEKISGGAVRKVVGLKTSASRYDVDRSRRDITQEFAGLSFGPIDAQADFGFVVAEDVKGLSSLVRIGGLPHFLSLDMQSCTLFLSACTEIADIQWDSDGTFGAAYYFSKLVPVFMFLKYSFGARCWHNPRKFARIIIDDPVLRKRYGFLRFDKLMESAGNKECGFSIGFIPWNYRRTNSIVAELFKRSAPHLSVCVHGCDHTQGEFAIRDEHQLNLRTILAVQRMEELAKRTGLLYENVMIFPQGRFSPQALNVLKCNNFLGAVNSGAVPEGQAGKTGLTIEDFLTPAVMRFHSFPLFVRRYPGEIADFAWDLFFNKPALVVEHHGYFKNGYGELCNLVQQLNSLSPSLRWAGLDEIVASAHLQKQLSGSSQYRMFTNSHVIENAAEAPEAFLLTKTETDTSMIEGLLVDGRRQEFEGNGKEISFRVVVPARRSVYVSVRYRNAFPARGLKTKFTYGAAVFVRRYLSEFRDNVLARNGVLLRLAQSLRTSIL